jgi:hypothetical protein
MDRVPPPRQVRGYVVGVASASLSKAHRTAATRPATLNIIFISETLCKRFSGFTGFLIH